MHFDTVIHTNQQSIDRVLNAGMPVVLVFGRDESQAGKQMDSLLDEAARRNAGILLIARIDPSVEEQLVQRYGIQQWPTLVLVKAGETVATVPGIIGKADLNAWFKYLVDGGDRPVESSRDGASVNGTQQVDHNGSGQPLTLTDTNFQQVIGGPGPVLVDFWAPWCGPCRMVAPAVEQLAQEFAGRATVGKLNVDENPRTSQQYGIMSIPALYIFKNGQPVDQIVGAQPAQVLRQRLTAHV